MDLNQYLWDSLRSKGHVISDVYLQTGVWPVGSRLYVVIDDVAMSLAKARALDRGILTVTEIAKLAEQETADRAHV